MMPFDQKSTLKSIFYFSFLLSFSPLPRTILNKLSLFFSTLEFDIRHEMVKIKKIKFVWGTSKIFWGRCTRSCTLHHSGTFCEQKCEIFFFICSHRFTDITSATFGILLLFLQ